MSTIESWTKHATDTKNAKRSRKAATAPAEEPNRNDRRAKGRQTAGREREVRRNRRKWLDRLGFYEYVGKATKSTTRQVSGLFLATAGAPTSHLGLFVGKEQHTGWPYYLDVFAAYKHEGLSSANVCVFGDVGYGKSSFIKTWGVIRQLMLGRRVVVIDKKRQQRGAGVIEGEYAQLARALGVEPIKFVIGKNTGGSCVNVLDPAIGGEGTSESGASQMQLLRAVLTEALGRDVGALEGKALSVARKCAIDEARATGRVATIRDVLHHLEDPHEGARQYVSHRTSLDDLARWGLEAAAELERLVDEDLAGLIDGPTSGSISLTKGLTVFDISALPDTGPAVPIVMAVVNSWLRAVIDNQADPVPTVFVVEEGWHLVSGTFATIMERNQKLTRGESLENITALHHLSDVAKDSPARAAIKEAAVAVMYRQDRDEDAAALVELFGLPPSAHGVLMQLPKGSALIKVGDRKPVLVTHYRSAWEERLTDTDEAMHSTATVSLHGDNAQMPAAA
ncbi:ATP/GTP-binding protein [Luteimicrobium sp. DT211]|uniref:ATP/GTP-binding protein n=1 Tax=Luteimicrobium sp. DT211 TaxID=3393412 RepID=UPI003CF6F8DF